MIALYCTALLAAAPVAIEDVRVELGDGGVLPRATVVFDESGVLAVGPGAPVPAGALRLDGKGKVLTPGLIDVASHLGLREVDLEPDTVDEHLDAPFVPAFRAAEGFNPRSVWIPASREEGVTSAVLRPTSGILSGQGHWVPFTGRLGDLPALDTPVAHFGVVGRAAARFAGGARGGVWLALREVFADARAYARNRAAYEKNAWRSPVLKPIHLDALAPVLARQVPLVLEADRASDLLAALAFARAEDVRLVLLGAAEAHAVAAQLAQAQVPVILVPSRQVPDSFEAVHARDDAAALLARAGVPLILTSADFWKRRLRQEAGLAVAHGLPRAQALQTITSTPARVFGLPASGTVEVKRRADLVLWNGDPLEAATLAERVFIGGVEQPDDARHRALARRYLPAADGGSPP